MASKNYNLVRGRGNGLTNLSGTFQLTGASPSAPVVLTGGNWYSVVHTNVGLYTVTLTDVFPQTMDLFVTAAFATGETFGVGIESQIPPGAGFFIVRLYTPNTGAPVDPTNNLANRVSMLVCGRNSTVA